MNGPAELAEMSTDVAYHERMNEHPELGGGKQPLSDGLWVQMVMVFTYGVPDIRATVARPGGGNRTSCVRDQANR